MKIPQKTLIASGPVIIRDDKVLLVKERKKDGTITDWFFPGGTAEESDASLEDVCIRECDEELGVTLTITKELRTIFKQKPDGTIIELHHFLAEYSGTITPGENIVVYEWFAIDNLPPDCAENVREIIADYRREREPNVELRRNS